MTNNYVKVKTEAGTIFRFFDDQDLDSVKRVLDFARPYPRARAAIWSPVEMAPTMRRIGESVQIGPVPRKAAP